MPYSLNTRVPVALLRILHARLGEKKTARLLHDYLEAPNWQIAQVELSVALDGWFQVQRRISLDDGDHQPDDKIVFKAKIGKYRWDGITIDIGVVPESISRTLCGRTLNSIIDHPYLGDEVITSVDDPQMRGTVTLSVTVPYVTMADIRPSLPSRLLGGLRRRVRHMRYARKVRAHTGFRIWVPLTSLFVGAAAFFAAGLLAMLLLLPFKSLEAAAGAADIVSLIAAPVGMAITWLLTVYSTGNSEAFGEYVADTLRATGAKVI